MNFILVISLCLFYTLSYSQARYEVIISEIMADPTPVVGLPNTEWIELTNITSYPVNLQHFRLADATGQSGQFPSYTLQPGSFVIICPINAESPMNAFGPSLGISGFPSLDNGGETVSLKNAAGNIIHAVEYLSNWHQNALKKEGGWSLEMIDTNNPCTGKSNWTSSNALPGGSPGSMNSVANINNDNTSPVLLRTYAVNDSGIVAVFNEPLDSLTASSIANYEINNSLSIVQVTLLSPLFNTVKLMFNDSLHSGVVYEIKVMNIMDCRNNIILPGSFALAGKPVVAHTRDLVLNELLFNPKPGQQDYIEIFNRSAKILDASHIYLANRNTSNAINNISQLSQVPMLIFPGSYMVATADEAGLVREYLVSRPDWVIDLPSPPSMPDDEGKIILMNQQGSILDEVHYSHNWHFKLLKNEEGVALERIDPDGDSQNGSNWHSAASTVGYGTPTSRNSQYRLMNAPVGEIVASPSAFSPDNDGRDDLVIIQYKMTELGYVANITFFNLAGRPVKFVAKNQLLGMEGYWSWRGLDENNLPLPSGAYIMYAEVFNLKGKVQRFRSVVFLIR